MVCQQCGQEASSEHAFCSACGAPLAGSVPPAYTGQPDQGNAAPAADRPYQNGAYPDYPEQHYEGAAGPAPGQQYGWSAGSNAGQPYQGPGAGQPYQSGPYPPNPGSPYQSGPYPPNPGSPYEGSAHSGPVYPGGHHGQYQPYGGPPGAPGQYPPYPGGSGQYPPPPPGMPYGQPWRQMNRTGTNRYSNIGIVLGIISFILLPIILGPAGLIVSGVARSRGESRANIGLVVSGLGLVCGIILSLLAHHAVYG